MKTLMPKFCKTLFCRLITVRLVILMLQLTFAVQIENATAAETYGTNSVQAASPSDGTAADTADPHLVQACGPLCALIVVLIILGVAAAIIAGLLKMCHNLLHPKHPKNPDDPDQNNLVPKIQTKLVLHNNLTTTGARTMETSSGTLPVIELDDTNAVTGYSIIPGSVCLDGTTNGTFLDRNGYPYCSEFETVIVSSTNATCWSNAATVCTVKGWVSFSNAHETASGTDTSKFWVQGTPQNLLIVCYTNGVAASRAYYPVSTTTGNMDPNAVPSLVVPAGTSPNLYYRTMAAPVE